MKIYYSPDYKKNNNGLVDAFKYCGCDIIEDNYPLWNVKKICETDLFVFNWYENIYKSKTALWLFVKKVFFLFIIKSCKKKIVFIFHNKQPHVKNIAKPSIYLSCIVLKLLIKLSDYVVILSKYTRECLPFNLQKYTDKYKNKFFYIPHRDFNHLYRSVRREPSPNALNMLFLGRADEYKNPEILINVMNRLTDKPIYLTFEGKTDEETLKKLQNLNINNHVNFNCNFLSDESLAEEFAKYDLCIYPFGLESCLNSSSILLSFSLHKTVISTQLSTLKDVPPDLYYGYSYDSKHDHEIQLYDAILKAYNEKMKNPDVLIKKGDACAEYLRRNNNQEIINENVKKMLSGLV